MMTTTTISFFPYALRGLLLALLLAGPGLRPQAWAQCASGPSLVASYVSNNAGGGVQFDIQATVALTVRSFDINMSDNLSGNYAVYIKTGSYVGSENTAANWTLVGSTSAAVVSQGLNNPTPLPIPINIAIAAGQTQAFYISSVGGGGLRYLNGTGRNSIASNADLDLLGGTGRVTGDAFSSLAINYRSFNGTVHYSTGPGPVITTFSPASGSPGTVVAVSGANLGGLSDVRLNGTAVSVPGTPTATGFSFVVGAASSTGPLALTATAGTAITPCNFTVLPPLLISSRKPRRNALHVPVDTVVTLSFNQPLSSGAATLGALKVFSSQRGGRLQNGTGGAATVSGSILSFDPTTNFRPGETLFTTVTTAATSSGGSLARGQVQQFTTAVGGTGGGNFLAPATGANVPTAHRPYALAMGDVDGDGDVDMLTANANASTVSLRLNDGSGGFTGTTEIPVAARSRDLALADVDGDGDLDLVAAAYGNSYAAANSTVSIRLNDGSGTFSAPALNAEVSVEPRPNVVKMGDIDGDGDLDLVVSMYDANNEGVALVRFNDGSGGFSGTQRLTTTDDLMTLELGDVDGDGDLDLLIAQSAYFSGVAQVGVFLNDGTGVFGATASTTVAVGSSTAHIRMADVDGDGDLDFVAASINDGELNLRLNDGTGIFTTPPGGNYSASGAVVGMELKDIDADGDLDLVFNQVNAGQVSVLRNDGTGTFAAPPAPYQTFSVDVNNYALALADVDNDGDLDILSAGSSDNRVNVLLNQPLAPLPVELVAFTAEAQGQAALLRWRTASEKNSARFEVERSADGRAFTKIGEQAGQGTTSSPTAYAYLDLLLAASPNHFITYYRLRQVDQDGTASYSPVRAVTLGDVAAGLALFPNPTRTAANLTGAAPGSLVAVFDALGREITTARADAGGTAVLTLPPGLPTGVYLVRSGTQVRRLAVE